MKENRKWQEQIVFSLAKVQVVCIVIGFTVVASYLTIAALINMPVLAVALGVLLLAGVSTYYNY